MSAKIYKVAFKRGAELAAWNFFGQNVIKKLHSEEHQPYYKISKHKYNHRLNSKKALRPRAERLLLTITTARAFFWLLNVGTSNSHSNNTWLIFSGVGVRRFVRHIQQIKIIATCDLFEFVVAELFELVIDFLEVFFACCHWYQSFQIPVDYTQDSEIN